ncbi:DUF2288 domain-containing protein [Methylomonas sp. AM2-LC]|uniref:DUF2288 domain-containing protein n=1 Tax=Methylomonas sp. AM2-LC TaxID=3153301 RepID=UPI0032650123
MSEITDQLDKTKVNLETSQIPWIELQRFFASGLAIAVCSELDLIEVAYQFSKDNKSIVAQWLKDKQIGHVSDQQAIDWLAQQRDVWAVVVKPWVLVQLANNNS